jgi:serine/threonine protein kinase
VTYHNRRIGTYRVTRCLGSGGMGTVWAANDEASGREVAIKFLRSGVVEEKLALARFRRELRALEALSHPGIVRMLASGDAGGEPYLVMEAIDGTTVADLMTRTGPVPMERALEICADVLDALDYMHARAFIHRDIKPANVMIEKSGRTVLMDLGLVKIPKASGLTSVGAVVGTPRSMAPEMLAGRPGDARMDLYQVGFLLYEMVSRRTPYDPAEIVKMVHGQVDLAPRPIPELAAGAQGGAWTLMQNALEPRPERRYSSAREMASDTRAVRAGRTIERLTEARRSVPAGFPRPVLDRWRVVRMLRAEPLFTWYEAVGGDPAGGGSGAGARRAHLQVVAPGLGAGAISPQALDALRRLAGLSHPGLWTPLAVEEGGAEGAAPCLVYPEPAGRLLVDVLESATADSVRREVVDRFARGLAAALAHVHRLGRAHGYLDPETVRLTDDWEPLVGGLELSPVLDGGSLSGGLETTRKLSVYAAPEQLDGTPATPAGDVYSAARLVLALAERAGAADLAAWQAVLETALSADPARRPPDGAALARILDDAPPPGRVPARASGRRRRVARSRWASACAAALAGLAAAAAWVAWPVGGQIERVNAGVGQVEIAWSTVRASRGRVTVRPPAPAAPIVMNEPEPAARAHVALITQLAPGVEHAYQVQPGGFGASLEGTFRTRRFTATVERMEHAIGSVAIKVRTSLAARGKLTLWPEGRLAELREAAGTARAGFEHTFRASVSRTWEAHRYRLDWELPGGEMRMAPEPGRVDSVEDRLAAGRRVVEALVAPGAVAVPLAARISRARVELDEAERLASGALASADAPRSIRQLSYSALALLDLVDARLEQGGEQRMFAVERWLPPQWTWTYRSRSWPDVLREVAIPQVQVRGPGRATSPIGILIDEDPAGIAVARLVVVPPEGTPPGWEGRILGISVNGSVELLFRDRGRGSQVQHTFDPSWLVRGGNQLVVRRGTLAGAAALQDRGPWRVQLEIVRKRP